MHDPEIGIVPLQVGCLTTRRVQDGGPGVEKVLIDLGLARALPLGIDAPVDPLHGQVDNDRAHQTHG